MLGFYLALIDEPNDKEKFMEIYNKYKDMMFCKAMSVLRNIKKGYMFVSAVTE
ncbi:MAG: hypothetical protein IJ007_04515 [Oscillospiraceae bacterium]|nr:hypothetical protein [Oscillospiraceae bacterium]